MDLASFVRDKIKCWPNWLNAYLLRMNCLDERCYGRSYQKFSSRIDLINPEQELLRVVNYAIQNVPYYREKYGGLLVRNLSEFEDNIGFIDKDEVMANWDKFVADGVDLSKCNTGTTGGTSGKAMKLLIPKNRYVVDRAFTHRQLKQFGWNYDTFAVIRNHKLPENKDYMINPVMKLVIFDAFRLDGEYVKKIYATMRMFHIRCIHAYPSGLFRFCKLCQEQGLDLSFVKLCRLTSEQITDEQRALFDSIGLRLCYSYGHSERLILAANRPTCQNYFVESSYGYCELLSSRGNVVKKSQELGEIVGTGFNNYYFPLIRYRTGDFSSYVNDVSETPYNKVLTTIYGRWQSTMIYCKDGREVSPSSLNLHDSLYEKIDGLQYRQKEKGKLEVLIVKGKGYDAQTELSLLGHFTSCLGDDTEVQIVYVKNLIYQPNGKFLLLISDL